MTKIDTPNRYELIQPERAKRARAGYKKSAICHMHDACEGVAFLWAVCLSSQVLGPSSLIFSGYVGIICGSAYFKNHLDWLRYKKVLLVAMFCNTLENVNFSDFML